jgi:hypothetical protein
MHAIFSSRTGSISLATHGYVYRLIVKTSKPSLIKPEINLQEAPFLFSALPLECRYSGTGCLVVHLATYWPRIFLFYVLCKNINFRTAAHCCRQTLDYLTALVHLMRLCSFKWKGKFKNDVSTAKVI